MLHTLLILFTAGSLTILLPCILPLVPVVLGVSIAQRHPLRPLCTVMGMVLSFVVFTFVLQVVLSRFVEAADIVRIGTYDVLLLFGVGFVAHAFIFSLLGSLAGATFFLGKGWMVIGIAFVLNVIALHFGGRIASRIQQTGADLQQQTRSTLGQGHELFSAFLVGMTLGLVWVPCAGPALGFALAVVRDEPGLRAFGLLSAYALGAGMPLLIVGYGGQFAVGAVRALTRYSGLIKQIAGVLLIVSAVALRLDGFTTLQVWLADHTRYGTIGTDIEERLFKNAPSPVAPTETSSTSSASSISSTSASQASTVQSDLPKIVRAPEFAGLGPWHNSSPLTMKELRGKVVLVDF